MNSIYSKVRTECCQEQILYCREQGDHLKNGESAKNWIKTAKIDQTRLQKMLK